MPETPRRGGLKIFLGYAAGVGKTYAMLSEAQKLKQEGKEIVIGYFEPHRRKDTIMRAEGLEVIPRRKIQYRGATFEEMDPEAVLRRRPEVCIVDEFAHTNVPGAERAKRWEDVQKLLEVGIDVLTTMNVQHIESLNDQICQITGVRVRETVPDWVIQQAEEVVMVDVTPRALLNRLARGVVYEPEKAKRAAENFFKESTLVALREMALRQTAHEVESRQTAHNGSGSSAEALESGTVRAIEPRQPRDRILLYITSDPSTAALIRRGKRVADYLHADCFAVSVHEDRKGISAHEREVLEKHLTFARNLHIETHELQGSDTADTLVKFARKIGVTQVFLMRRLQNPWPTLFGRDLLQRIVRLASDMQVTIVAERGSRQTDRQTALTW